ncbi:hypothetical protein B0J18DRAFT_488539 [Chaetomium sp. MPI-SDFR-AT-0129]|nr:hypothetical protein B0J18DRAFT_488539 [Chaetomium sp. MPI-SDFR-AT-0129]
MAAIAIQIQPFGRKPVCVADAFEQNFRFGPVPGPVPVPPHQQEGTKLPGAAPCEEVDAGGQQPSQPAASFLARVDGGIPCCKPRPGGEMCVAFEAKRSPRGGQQPHVTGLTHLQRNHHTLIISQDATEIFFSVSTYTDAYLSYLFSSSSDPARVILPNALDTIPVLKVEEFGPFRINLEEELRLVAQLVLALLLWQMEDFEAGKLMLFQFGLFSAAPGGQWSIPPVLLSATANGAAAKSGPAPVKASANKGQQQQQQQQQQQKRSGGGNVKKWRGGLATW